MTVNPRHFHAALVQKNMLEQVDPTVYIYGPDGPDVEQHIERIEGFNSREESPTDWKMVVYRGDDYLERMIREKSGNVMVTAGNNRDKTEYRSEEHTSELQSRGHLVCRLLLEKKKN